MNRKRLVFLVLILIPVILLIVNLFKNKNENRIIKEKKKVIKVDRRKEVIESIKLFVDTKPIRTVRVKPVLYRWVPKDKVVFHYTWFVNGEEVENDDLMLGSDYLNKGDKVYCIVKPFRKGKNFKIVKSKEVVVPNSPPVIKYTDNPYIDDSGEFNYTVTATDIDDDELTYSLIDPIDGISIDETNGEISVDLQRVKNILNQNAVMTSKEEIMSEEEQEGDNAIDSEKEARSLNTVIVIKFKVVDSEGAECIGSIMFDIMKGKDIGV